MNDAKPDVRITEGLFREAARLVLDDLDDDFMLAHPHHRSINPDHIEQLANGIQLFIAELVASLIDAGSERDAVMEAEPLHDAIVNELKDWV